MTIVELAQKFEGHEGAVTGLKYSKDYNYLISSSEDSTIRIWSLKNGKQVTKLEGHLGGVNSLVLNSSDNRIFSGGSDSSICWWDVQRGELIKKIRAHSSSVNSVCFNDDSSIAISGSLDTTAKIWDCRSNGNMPVQVLSDASDSVTCVKTGRYEIFTSSVDGKLRIYDIRRGCLTTDKIADSIVNLELSKDKQTILITTLDSRIILTIKFNGDVLQTYRGHSCENYMIRSRFAANEATVVSGSETGEVFVWELVEGTVQQRFAFGEGPILDVEIQDPFVSIAAASADGSIGIFRKPQASE
ncbi:WD repeat domain-containing protein 83 [Tritrichomonas foetus]|uniref:WD repeat domain-containing protein 83 n=1 Tax=Tritrichomonas foetus TaxID=1144522 RepID=A0A1J4JQM7_9EUKA|nr:WD repeat domain-containing protein 83 [Tritrichomonas foetus]|eukprot:OHS99540.1 WD repeat domain-containing protein 83 [Tritrichomonas foetus]